MAVGGLEKRFTADFLAGFVLIEKNNAEVAVRERTADFEFVILGRLHDEVSAQDLCGGGRWPVAVFDGLGEQLFKKFLLPEFQQDLPEGGGEFARVG